MSHKIYEAYLQRLTFMWKNIPSCELTYEKGTFESMILHNFPWMVGGTSFSNQVVILYDFCLILGSKLCAT